MCHTCSKGRESEPSCLCGSPSIRGLWDGAVLTVFWHGFFYWFFCDANTKKQARVYKKWSPVTKCLKRLHGSFLIIKKKKNYDSYFLFLSCSIFLLDDFWGGGRGAIVKSLNHVFQIACYDCTCVYVHPSHQNSQCGGLSPLWPSTLSQPPSAGGCVCREGGESEREWGGKGWGGCFHLKQCF